MAPFKLPMPSGVDPLLLQAETIFAQRKSRGLTLPPDILGEPAWDILLLAFIAHRKATVCARLEAAEQIGLSPGATQRWIKALALRDLLVVSQDGAFFSISEDAEAKLSAMFIGQIKQIRQELRFEDKRNR